MVKALAALAEPVGVDARAVQWLDELVSRAAIVQGESKCPLGRMAAVLAALTLRSEGPSAPWSGGEPRNELVGRALEIADDERDLERATPSSEGTIASVASPPAWQHARKD